MMYSIFSSKRKLVSRILHLRRNLKLYKSENKYEVMGLLKKNRNKIMNFQSLWVL